MGPLRRTALTSGALAVISGLYGVLSLMGAFGPVSCWERQSVSGSASQNGSTGPTTTEVSRGCKAGIDFPLGSAGPPGGGNAAVLFGWAMVLLGVVALGSFAVASGRHRLTWVAGGVGAVVSVLGIWSVGWYFMLPAFFLLVAAGAQHVRAQRQRDELVPS